MKHFVRFLAGYFGVTTEIQKKALKELGSRLVRTQNAFEGPGMDKFINKQVAKDVFFELGQQLEKTGSFDPMPVAAAVQKRDKQRWVDWSRQQNDKRREKKTAAE